MKKLLLMIVVISLAGAAPAIGQLDPDPDGIGLYADLEGMNNSLLTPPGVIDVYLLATNISDPMIKDWIVSVRIDGNAVMTDFDVPYEFDYFLANPAPATYGLGGTAFPDSSILYTELVRAPVIHLATLQLWISDTAPIDLYLGLVALGGSDDGEPIYVWNELTYPFDDHPDRWVITSHTKVLHPSSGSPDLPVMRINGDAPVPVEPTTWSDLQAAFR